MNEKLGLEKFNTTCITQVSSTMLSLLGIHLEKEMALPIPEVLSCAKKFFKTSQQTQSQNEKICDRIFMYNPDAISEWIFARYYKKYFYKAQKISSLALPMLSVFPPVTPVCFASMYSGLLPQYHGIQSYEKPVLKCKTVFDTLIENEKKVAIVSTENDSISLIFLERKMDYFIYKTVRECNEKAAELIKADKHDCIILYNTDYDYWMHRNSPTGFFSKKAIQQDVNEFCSLHERIKNEWQGKHRIALAFAPDHGCHRWFGILGQHGKNEPCDMNIKHLWAFL